MNQYRILEKKGTTEEYILCYDKCGPLHITKGCACEAKKSISEKYIPRYIVQEYKQNPEIYKNEDCVMYQLKYGIINQEGILFGIETYIYIDLKEFDCIDQARQFKRNLELKDGIVIE